MANTFTKTYFILSILIFFSATVAAEQWTAPNEIIFQGTPYKLAYKQNDSPQQQLYEYTSNDEPIEKWSSLFSVIFTKSYKTPFSVIAANIGKTVMARNPKPQIKIYEQGDYLISRVIYDFSEKSPLPYFESNARKIFYSESCGGFFDISIANKILSGFNINEKLVSENEALTNKLLANSLKPECIAQNNAQQGSPRDLPHEAASSP